MTYNQQPIKLLMGFEMQPITAADRKGLVAPYSLPYGRRPLSSTDRSDRYALRPIDQRLSFTPST